MASTEGEHHRNLSSGGARAAVFGMSDGLLTNLSLILGFAGAHPSGSVVRLAGLAGLIAGACSMASGEWVSVKSQTELLERELEVERQALATSPEEERRELQELYLSKGLSEDLAARMATEVMANPKLALEVHAREELGIDPNALGSPWLVAGASFLLFALGALLPLIPWLISGGTAAVWWSIGLGLAGAAALGGTVSRMSGKSIGLGALRQVLITAIAALVTTGIGALVGAG